MQIYKYRIIIGNIIDIVSVYGMFIYGENNISGNIKIKDKYELLLPNTFFIVKNVNIEAISTIMILNIIAEKKQLCIACISTKYLAISITFFIIINIPMLFGYCA